MPNERRRRTPTSTSNFGVSRREAHDASAFYARFEAPELSGDDEVLPPKPVTEPFVCGDARHMDTLLDGSVALVVTSPPYFTGKQYEEEVGLNGIPGSYLEYLQLLRDVFAECKRKLEPGGRIAVNVANLGRKPYRSLSADVMSILQDDLHLLPRGEVIWRKAEGASGSCAWGSFRSATNPVLRDVTERVVIASKGRFDRAKPVKERERLGLPYESSLTSDEFMAATLDVWEIPSESARRVQHPAPFPVELPQRLITLHTYRDDLVLDPFMGVGSALVAAARTGRRYAGYDTDARYVAMARERVAAVEEFEPQSDGASFQATAERVVVDAGFTITGRDVRVRGAGMTIPLVARDQHDNPWYFDVTGAFTSTPTGLARAETVWKALGRAHVVRQRGHRPLVMLTTHLPRRPSDADSALRSAGTGAFFDAIELLSPLDQARLAHYATTGQRDQPLVGFWTRKDLP